MSKAKTGQHKSKRKSAPSTREQILKTALLAFSRQGFDGASFAQIAREVGVAQALIHYHFGNKEQLWQEAVEVAIADFEARFLATELEFGELDALQRAKVITRRFTHFVAKHPELLALWMHELQNDTPRLTWLIERYLRPLTDVYAAVLEDAITAGLIKPISRVHLITISIGAVSMFLAAKPAILALTAMDPSDPAIVESHANAVVEVLFSGMQA